MTSLPMILLQSAFAAAEPAVEQAQTMSPGTSIAWASALMLLAALLALTEFLVVSWGMLLVGAVVSALSAIMLAFNVSPIAGWIFVAATPVLTILVIRNGFVLMRRNASAVMPTEVTADAGYHHLAEASGVAVGAIGELTTAAYPTGRARFAGSKGAIELDVQVQGAVLARGDRVVVLAIAGPVITVGPAPDTISNLMTTNPKQG